MPTFVPYYVEPGSYPKYKPADAFPVIPGGPRVICIIGEGSVKKSITGAVIEKEGWNTFDNLPSSVSRIGGELSPVRVYTQTDEFKQGRDFLVEENHLDWDVAEPAQLITGTSEDFDFKWDQEDVPEAKTLEFSIGGGAMQTIVFDPQPTPAPLSADEVVSIINTQSQAEQMGVTATAIYIPNESPGSLQHILIETDISVNTSILVGEGTANAFFGFGDGQIVYSSQQPEPGTEYYVDYSTDKEDDDYDPRYYFSMQKISEDWGEPSLEFPLTLGAQIASENGAVIWLIAPLKPSDGSTYQQYQKALERIEGKGCNVIVPMTGNDLHFPLFATHVEKMSTQLERMWRTCILGLNENKDPEHVMNVARSLNSRRIVFAYPGSVTRLVSDEQVEIPGMYLAAALGGIRVNPTLDVATPLTRRVVRGFTGINTNVDLRIEKNLLAAAGVCIVDSDGAGLYVRHGKTTATDTVLNQEISITEITDYISEVVFRVLENTYVGRKITRTRPVSIEGTVRGILTSLIENDMLVDFQNVSAVQNDIDATQVDVTFEISPVMPLNYIPVTFTIPA